MFGALTILYSPKFARVIAYMLQATEYSITAYIRWFWRTEDFRRIIYRKDLVLTRPSRLILRTLQLGMFLQIVTAIVLGIWSTHHHTSIFLPLAVALLLITPIFWAHLITIPLLLGRYLIIKPYYAFEVWKSRKLFTEHRATRIAVGGSYGKTSMKEILLTVLSEGKKTAATPANKNVSISHARFAQSLEGDEEILIIEFGEGAPGDVKKFTSYTKPHIGVITGLAPAHLDKYKTVEKAGRDIFSLADYLKDQNVYVNAESSETKPFLKSAFHLYSYQGVDRWVVSNLKQSIEGVKFVLSNGKTKIDLRSRLIGNHQVGPLALAAVLGLELGLSAEEVKAGVAKTEPFEHRMEPKQLSGGWLIDDTYNGNIEGMKAGLTLLKELPAKRKVYITPGLVDQGKNSVAIHEELGKAITKANPDLVVLIKHSVTDDIVRGINDGNYKGELRIESDPLDFYTNLKHFMATGDLVLMQNDWADNYN